MGGLRLTGQSVLQVSGLGYAASHRGRFGSPRPERLAALALPPGPMPSHAGARPLKAWRYVGVFGSELMLCVASARIGPARQCFWAVWDRAAGRLHERTRLGAGRVSLTRGHVHVADGPVVIELELAEEAGIETICPSGSSYAWTRKQGGIRARGMVTIEGRSRPLDARAVVDDTAAYYERHTQWRWSAGVGIAGDGRELAWNLVAGVNDPVVGSERTLWIDGHPIEVAPVRFSSDLSSVGGLRFAAEATRERNDNRLLVRSRYRQPFGVFTGEPTPGVALAEGYGVMEHHDAWW